MKVVKRGLSCIIVNKKGNTYSKTCVKQAPTGKPKMGACLQNTGKYHFLPLL